MPKLSSYSRGGDTGITNQTAKQLRRLVGLGAISVFDYMTEAQIADITSNTGAIDCSAAVQAAIDAAYAQRISTVYMPSGLYRWNSTVYLDPPSNLRTGPLSGAPGAWVYSFSLALVGEQGNSGNYEAMGTQIRFYGTNSSALWVGPGNGMYVGYMTIRYEGTMNVDRFIIGAQRTLSSLVAGISIAGGNAGSSRTLIERVGLINFYVGVDGDRNFDTLGDSITLFKCWIKQCYFGVYLYGTQNYIVHLIECNINDCANAVRNVGVRVKISGGNYSTDSVVGHKHALSSISSVTVGTETADGGATVDTLTFTAVLASPGSEMQYGILYDIGVIKTTNYGWIPLHMTAWNHGTSTATFKVRKEWITSHYPFAHPISTTDLQTEIQAATHVWITTYVRLFIGGGFAVSDIHVENQFTCTCLCDQEYTVTGAASLISIYDGVYINYDVGHDSLELTDNVWFPTYACQQVFPFIKTRLPTIFRGGQFISGSGSKPFLLEMYGNQNVVSFQEMVMPRMNVRETMVDNGYLSTVDAYSVRVFGGPIADRSYYSSGSDTTFNMKNKGLMRHPMYGNRPAPYVIPRLLPSTVTAIESNTGSMAPMHGEAYYQVVDYSSGRRKYAFVKSAARGYTYAADLTLTGTWQTKGRSPVITFSNTSDHAKMFVGLVLILPAADTDGFDRHVMVTGWYPATVTSNAYITVNNLDNNTEGGVGFGTSGTVYDGTTLGQQGFQMQKFGRQITFGSAVPSTGTQSAGELWNADTPAIGAPAQAWSTAAGTPATWVYDRLLDGAPQNAVTAAGTNQGTATTLTYSEIIRVGTAASGTGVKLPAAKAGMRIFFRNDGANPVTVYPTGSETINGTSSKSVTNGTSQQFFSSADGTWFSLN